MRFLKQAIYDFAEDVVDAARRNLGAYRTVRGKKRRSVSTGTLKDSLQFKNKTRGKNITLEFGASGKAEKYAKYVHSGVNGTDKSQGSPFSFKRGGGTKPAKGQMGVMQQAIYDWIKQKPIRLRNSDGGFIKSTEDARRNAAFLITRSIRKKGIEANPYYTDAIESELEKHKDKIAEALKQDVLAVVNL